MQAKLEVLKSSFSQPVSFCRGVLPLEDNALRLMYGGRDGIMKSGFINFANTNDDEVRQLFEACNSGGTDNSDAMDIAVENYGKLDRRDFKTGIDLERAGLMDAIHFDLLDGAKSAKSVYAELDGLEVYGTGPGYKTRQESARNDGTFGTLVVILPAAHEGGALVLRHDGKETILDTGAIFKYATEPSIAYVAFLNDVEHELQPITAGYRVALTYRLYFRDAPSQMRSSTLEEKKNARTLPPTQDAFLFALQRLLADPTFLPDGGVLGFGLAHEYPVRRACSLEKKKKVRTLPPTQVAFLSAFQRLLAGPTFLPDGGVLGFGLSHEHPVRRAAGSDDDTSPFKELQNRLKGRDALVLTTCRALSLPVSIRAVYVDQFEEYEILSDAVVDLGSYDSQVGWGTWEVLKDWTKNTHVISIANDPPERGDPHVDFPVHWVTKKTVFNEFKREYAKYGNSAELQYLYGKMCLIVEVGPSGKRA